MPIALISLVDESRAWFKSCIGFDAREVPRDATLCSFAVLTNEPLIIPDTLLDERFACNRFVQSEPGVRFYAGAPLLSRDGFNLGTLCLLDTQPRNQLTDEQQATLVDLAAMVVDELELRLAVQKITQVDEALLEITQGVATVTGEAFFAALVQHFAKVLDADYSYIGLVEGSDPKMLKTIATCARGQIVDNLEYSLQDTPCWEALEQRKICCYPRNVQAQFPHAPLLKPLEVESYVAIPFFDSNGTPLGLLGVMDGKPLENVQLAESLLTIFAQRIATEVERQLFEQERERFLAVSSDLQVITRTDGYFHWVSPSFERLLGWTVEEMTSHPWTDFVHPDDVNPSVSEADSLFCGSKTLAFENRYRHKDGSYRWLLWKAQLYSQGQVLYGAAVDITERKQREQALRQSEAQLRLAIEIAHLGTWRCDLGTNLVELDGRMREIWGEKEDTTLLPLSQVMERIHPEDRPQVTSAISAALDSLSSGNYEIDYRIVWDDGTERWISANGQVIFAGEGEFRQVIEFLGTALDITERKWAEQALRRSEEQSRNILESIDDGFLALNQHWQFTYINQSAEALLARASGDLIGKDFWQEFSGFSGSEFEQMYRGVMRERVARSLTAFYPDHERWYEVRTYPAANGITIYFRDVTEKIQAEEALRASETALRASEDRFRLMVESAKEYAIFTLDLNGSITSWNAGAERLLGYQEAEIIGRDAHILYTSEDNERGRADWEMQTARTQGQAVNECWHRRKDGSRFWGSGLVMPLQTEAGIMQGFVKIMQDKTKQRQAEQRFRLLYDTTSDLLATEQPLTLMHNLFAKLSAQLELDCYYNYMVKEKDNCQILHLSNYEGISDAEAQSLEWIELGQYLCGLVAQKRQQIVFDQTQLSSHPNAQLVCAVGITAYAGQPLIVHGRLLGTLSFASRTRNHFTPGEINLLQSTCDQMAIALERTNLITSIQQQAEQLQRANQLKDEFLAVLSHELRSPLNPILGWARLLQTGKLNAERQADALATIERNAKLQSQLIEDLLDISRIMQGKLSLTVAPINLTFVISSALETVRLAASAKNIKIVLDLDNTIAPISGDAVRLQQVVWNLLTNAVKFTPHSGQVTIGLRQVDRLAQIRVIDTGKGIAPNFLPHVFEYFRQEDGSTTRRFGGLGLGLAIVRQIVEMHGGTVKAESKGENQGATFIVQLPLTPQAVPLVPEPTIVPADTAAPLDNIQILLVDDDFDTREFQAFLLEQSGAKVTAVASGLEALQTLEQLIPDVLVSDVGMADMDGYMLMQLLRARPPNQGGAIPAIALTAYAAEVDRLRAIEAGFQAFVTKPVEAETLVKTLITLLDGNQQ